MKQTSITFFLGAFLMTMPIKAQNHSNSLKWNDNWEVGAGIEGLSFFGDNEQALELSGNPFKAYRFTLSAAAHATKWVSPTFGLRTKVSAYWGRHIQGNNKQENKTKFYAIQEHTMLNVHQMNGDPLQKVWNFIPYAGIGFARDCYQNDNSLTATIGIDNTFRFSNIMKAYLDLNYSIANHYRWIAAETGLSFNLGQHRWDIKNSQEFQGNKAAYQLKRYALVFNDKRANALPSGMTIVRRGSLKMGDVMEDTLWGKDIPSRNISVDDFWMDKTEVTNAMYRAFVNDVLDSVIQVKMQLPEFMGDKERVLASLYSTNPITGDKSIDGSQLYYKYETYNSIEALQKKYRHPDENTWISKDTAYVDEKGLIVREVIERPYTGAYDFLNTYIVNVYPDTTCWVTDFPHANNELYTKFYFNSHEYDNYPVVGVTWEQANAYCAWRTEKRKKELGKNYNEQPFRLPTEAEWEYAARGREQNEYPWAKKYSQNGADGFMANFMPEEGNLTKDGNIITSQVGIYQPNSNGLYDMAGNVAEWTSTAYSETGVEAMNGINPELTYHSMPNDPPHRRMKTVKGGSWKDPANHVQAGWRVKEQQDQPRSYIGFRCARSLTTTNSAKPVVKYKNIRK